MNYKFDKSKLTDMVSEAKTHKVGLTWKDTFQGQLNESRVPTGKSFDFPKVRAGEKIESKDIIINTKTTKDGVFFIVTNRDTSGMRGSQDKYSMWLADARGKPTHRLGTHSSSDGARKFAKNKGILAESVDVISESKEDNFLVCTGSSMLTSNLEIKEVIGKYKRFPPDKLADKMTDKYGSHFMMRVSTMRDKIKNHPEKIKSQIEAKLKKAIG